MQSYADVPLLSRYDIYQILMDYWADAMQDDIYVLVQEGWAAGKKLRELKAKKGEKLKETPDITVEKVKFKAELIPPALIAARFFSEQQAAVDEAQIALDEAAQALESFIEENSAEDGELSEALNDKDKVTKTTVSARLKKATDKDEKAALKKAQQLFEAEATAKKALKDRQQALDKTVVQQYARLTEQDIQTLLVDDKWLATLRDGLIAEIERATQQLAGRVQALEERYAEPLPAITESVEKLGDKVAGHLKAMGLTV